MESVCFPEDVRRILERREKDCRRWPCLLAIASVRDSPIARSLDRAILYESGVSTGPQNGHAELIEVSVVSKKRVEYVLRSTLPESTLVIDNTTFCRPIIEQILR